MIFGQQKNDDMEEEWELPKKPMSLKTVNVIASYKPAPLTLHNPYELLFFEGDMEWRNLKIILTSATSWKL